MKQVQQGFTLIELMIVIAIIGILAAIAIPQYQDFIARSQVTEGINLLGGAKTVMEENISQDGNFTDMTAVQLQAFGIKTDGKYVATMIATGGVSAGQGLLTATYRATGVSKDVASKEVLFSRSPAGNWTCSASSGTTGVLQKHLPKACRT